MKNKAQQEILGFVIIVLLVVIVGVIFLGINLRKPAEINTDDLEISNFLSSSAKYTTDCIIDEPLYADLKDIIEACYSNKICKDERNACDVVNITFINILSSPNPLQAGNDRPVKYNKIDIYYQADLEDMNTRNNIMEIELGNENLCSVKKAGQYIQYKYPGNLIVELESCK